MQSRESFGSRELIKALTKLCFTAMRSTGSSHKKYRTPRSVMRGQRPFIIVILNKKKYVPQTCCGYIKEIMCLGFDVKEIDESFD